MRKTKQKPKTKKRTYLLKRSPHSEEYPLKNYRLVRARIERGFRGKDIAELIGIPLPTLYAYEDLRTYPPVETQNKIAAVLGEDIDYLFPKILREYIKSKHKKSQDIYDLGERVDNDFNKLPARNSDPQKTFDQKLLTRIIKEVLDSLPWRQREIMYLRFGLFDSQVYTLREISKILRITPERIRGIEFSAITKLQKLTITEKLIPFFNPFN